MIKKIKPYLLALLVTSILCNCDSKKPTLPKGFIEQLLCYSGSICENEKGTRFGMIGDSWTDLIFGQPLILTLRKQLEQNHNYRITGATIGGERLDRVVAQNIHVRVIDEAGPDLRYMLISLGGNDLQGNAENYVGDIEGEKNKRLATLEANLLKLVREGNAYKIQKWGGAPLLWIINGYDYSNPDVPSQSGSVSCRPTLIGKGFSDSEVTAFTSQVLDDFNEKLRQITYIEPQLRYIDLRGTLGGPSVSREDYMYDCIHPNTVGFELLAQKYVQALEGYTSYER
ncbi:MAG: SGNH/GDSL hydrolase family protein [Spirochaetota bacterium]